ncbi:Nn.00g048040.m01.CDS01 [Neocucurbitaria sp. VM-36]
MASHSHDADFFAFAQLLRGSPRVLCLVGAGLSAPSGLATWRGTNGLWNDLELKNLASPKKFQEDPITVWRFYGERLLYSLAAQPNAAHIALAALAKWHDGWLTINQNVDGLLERTNHPRSRLLDIHGTLQLIRCTACSYAIDIQKPEDLPFLMKLATASSQSYSLTLSDLPHCPECKSLLRPGVVWFGERLAAGAPDVVDEWILKGDIDIVIAAGTSLEVFPAAEWVDTARRDGAALAVFELNDGHQLVDDSNVEDWLFEGDIAINLPKIREFIGCS